MVFVSASFPPFPANIPLRGYIEVLVLFVSARFGVAACACAQECARKDGHVCALFPCVCVCVYVCVSVCLSACLCVCVSVCLWMPLCSNMI